MDKRDIIEIFERFREDNPSPTSELVAHSEYTFCIAVLLSAQSTDKGVNKATAELFKIADTPEKMLDLGIDNLKGYIKTIGLYNNKAKNIMLLSEKLIKEYNSKLPKTREELELLPGVGRKSANVIMNKLFRGEYIAVDTHVFRVANRLGLSKKKTPLEVEKELVEIIPEEFHKNSSDWMVLHGRYVCLAKKPMCADCFLSDLCDFAKNYKN